MLRKEVFMLTVYVVGAAVTNRESPSTSIWDVIIDTSTLIAVFKGMMKLILLVKKGTFCTWTRALVQLYANVIFTPMYTMLTLYMGVFMSIEETHPHVPCMWYRDWKWKPDLDLDQNSILSGLDSVGPRFWLINFIWFHPVQENQKKKRSHIIGLMRTY